MDIVAEIDVCEWIIFQSFIVTPINTQIL